MTSWFLGSPASRELASRLDMEFAEIPTVPLDEQWTQAAELERWRASSVTGEGVNTVVVALWEADPQRRTVVSTSDEQWFQDCETAFATWFLALTVAVERCSDSGQVVAVVDRPDAKDAAGWGAVSCVADGVEIISRSLALIHEQRGVRVHVVSTPQRLGSESPIDVDNLADRVVMLQSEAAQSLNSTVLHEGEF